MTRLQMHISLHTLAHAQAHAPHHAPPHAPRTSHLALRASRLAYARYVHAHVRIRARTLTRTWDYRDTERRGAQGRGWDCWCRGDVMRSNEPSSAPSPSECTYLRGLPFSPCHHAFVPCSARLLLVCARREMFNMRMWGPLWPVHLAVCGVRASLPDAPAPSHVARSTVSLSHIGKGNAQ